MDNRHATLPPTRSEKKAATRAAVNRSRGKHSTAWKTIHCNSQHNPWTTTRSYMDRRKSYGAVLLQDLHIEKCRESAEPLRYSTTVAAFAALKHKQPWAG